MTFTNLARQVKLGETFHIHVDFVLRSWREMELKFTYGQDMLTLINEQLNQNSFTFQARLHREQMTINVSSL